MDITIRDKFGTRITSVEAIAVDIDGHTFGLHVSTDENVKRWTVTEPNTGQLIGRGETKEEALKVARGKIEFEKIKHGKKALAQAIATKIRERGRRVPRGMLKQLKERA